MLSGEVTNTKVINSFWFDPMMDKTHDLQHDRVENANLYSTKAVSFLWEIKYNSFSLCGFDHRDAWNLHANIIWSKRSTDFKELSPCSVWYPLKLFDFPNLMILSIPDESYSRNGYCTLILMFTFLLRK
jgi:hypothetical protein